MTPEQEQIDELTARVAKLEKMLDKQSELIGILIAHHPKLHDLLAQQQLS